MMPSRPAGETTMREARKAYFEANGFGPDGNYDEPWVDFKVGPLPFPFPNTPQRIDAVKFHDLHHVITGYATDLTGEFEISAWELAAGCKRYVAAWILNLAGLGGGLVTAPARVFAAFLRGARSRTLYGEPLEPILDVDVATVRARCVHESHRATVADVARFAAASVGGIVVGLTLLALFVAVAPVGLLTTWLRRRAARA